MGTKPRTPTHFPRMKHRSAIRRGRLTVRVWDGGVLRTIGSYTLQQIREMQKMPRRYLLGAGQELED